jgi:hypothetical protein
VAEVERGEVERAGVGGAARARQRRKVDEPEPVIFYFG